MPNKKRNKRTTSNQTEVDNFSLEQQQTNAVANNKEPARRSIGSRKRTKNIDEPDVLSYRHKNKRVNNPDVGLVTPDTDRVEEPKEWKYDPHIDPALQFDMKRSQIEKLIDDALSSGNEEIMRGALEQLKRQSEPYLNWAGKAERTSFEVDTVSLHVHERIDPATILAMVRKRIKGEKSGNKPQQADWLRAWFEEPLPLREAIDFYKHERGWANRLIAGDSLLVMNSLLQKESMAGQVQMIYIDPPYGIKYGSNFQPFVSKREVKDRKDEDLTQEPEMIKAFRDTWELGIHSYLTYLRDRLFIAKKLLHESGSVFVQISDENLHHTRSILDEIFGADNFCAVITFQKTAAVSSPEAKTNVIGALCDYLVWYARDKKRVKYNQLYLDKGQGVGAGIAYKGIRLSTGEDVNQKQAEKRFGQVPETARYFQATGLQSDGYSETLSNQFEFRKKLFSPGSNSHWKTTFDGLTRLGYANRIKIGKSVIRYVRFLEDFPASALANVWTDLMGASDLIYVVQTNSRVIERCILMTTEPGDLVLDPTCGSGTSAFVSEKWGRRWITCDTSRVSVTLAKQRLMTASYDYFDLKYPHEGIKAGFIYKTVPHITLKSIANNPELDEIFSDLHPEIENTLQKLNIELNANHPQGTFVATDGYRKGEKIVFGKGVALLEWEVPFEFPSDWPHSARAIFDDFHDIRQKMQKRMDRSIFEHADQEMLYDQPQISKDKLRITGPFTVEAVPFPSVLSLDEVQQPNEADTAVARSGESARQHTWRAELLKTGIRGKGGQMLRFASLEAVPSLRYIDATGTLTESGDRVAVSFGPEYAALEQRQVEMAMREAGELFPRPKMIVFCAFTFDPEAAKDIDQTKGITALKVQMNTDLLTEDLKKARASNQSFWLMGQPDVEVRKVKGDKYQIEVHGFDYFDTVHGDLISGGKGKIAMWLLDTDYDERSLFPRQVFFPIAGKKEGWEKLKKSIRAELDESLLDKFHGTVSLPFDAGENRKVAVKIIDDRGIESLKIIHLD